MRSPDNSLSSGQLNGACARTGFDCILGNPPWETVQLNEVEWFKSRNSEIASATGDGRKQRIKGLLISDPPLYSAYREALRGYEALSSFLGSSVRYPLCGRGKINLYSVFAELMRDGVSPIGRVGCIVPSGIATDDTTKFFFQAIVDCEQLVVLFSFENEEFLFPGVHHAMKFSLLVLSGSQSRTPVNFLFFARQVSALSDERRVFTLTRDEIALVNPNTKTCPIFRTKVDAELTKYIYRRVPVLMKEATATTPEENPWGVEFKQGLFNMTNDSDLFRTREQLEKDGWRLRGNVFERGAEKYLPLYEAKMVHHFNHRFATYCGATESQLRSGSLPKLSYERLADPSALALPSEWVPSAEVDARLAGRWDREWLLGWRDITNTTNERTVIAGLIPKCAVGHTCPLAMINDLSNALLATAVLASCVIDYVARQKVGGTHLTYHLIHQLPLCGRWDDAMEPHLTPRTLELSATADDMSPFSRDLWPEGDGAVFRYDSERRFEIRCELDAAFFHLYLGTTDDWSAKASPELLKALPTPRDAVAYIMETFPIVKKKDIAAHGVYRTKERIIALYDQLQLCLATNTPFVSALTPPPGPPTNADGSFAALPAWAPNTPRPANYPTHVHPPISHRS